MTRSDDVINEDGHDVIAAHTRVVRGMAAALAAIAATGAGVTAAAANVMFMFALDTKAKRRCSTCRTRRRRKASNSTCPSSLRPAGGSRRPSNRSRCAAMMDGNSTAGCWTRIVPTHSRIYTRSAAMAIPESPRKWPNGRIAMRNSVLRSCYPRSAPMN